MDVYLSWTTIVARKVFKTCNPYQNRLFKVVVKFEAKRSKESRGIVKHKIMSSKGGTGATQWDAGAPRILELGSRFPKTKAQVRSIGSRVRLGCKAVGDGVARLGEGGG